MVRGYAKAISKKRRGNRQSIVGRLGGLVKVSVMFGRRWDLASAGVVGWRI